MAMYNIVLGILEVVVIIALTIAVLHCWRQAARYFRTEQLIRVKTFETASALILMIAQRRESPSTDTSALRYGVRR